MPRNRSGLISVARPEFGVEVVGHGEDVVRRLAVEARRQDRRRTRAWSGASAGALKYSRTWSRSAASTCRNSGDWHSGTGSIAASSRSAGSGGNSSANSSSSRSLSWPSTLGEVRHHLGQRCGHASWRLRRGSSPTAIGHAHGVAPLGPRAVVVAHVRAGRAGGSARTRCGWTARRCGSTRSVSPSRSGSRTARRVRRGCGTGRCPRRPWPTGTDTAVGMCPPRSAPSSG